MPPASPIIAWLLAYRYAIIYPLTFFQGPLVMLVGGFLVRLGYFKFLPVYCLVVAADLTGDVVWYYIGSHGARPLIRKFGRFFNLTEEGVEKAESFFKRHHTKILITSKLTTGFGMAIAVLIAAGASKVPFKKYMTINFFGEFIWAGALMSIGYFFGHLYTLVNEGLRWLFIMGVTAIVLIASYGFSRFIKAKFAR